MSLKPSAKLKREHGKRIRKFDGRKERMREGLVGVAWRERRLAISNLDRDHKTIATMVNVKAKSNPLPKGSITVKKLDTRRPKPQYSQRGTEQLSRRTAQRSTFRTHCTIQLQKDEEAR